MICPECKKPTFDICRKKIPEGYYYCYRCKNCEYQYQPDWMKGQTGELVLKLVVK